jgi:HK97 family phage prohead protease
MTILAPSASELEILRRYDKVQDRVADIEVVDPDKGTILMRAAPYGVEAEIDRELWEQFDRATFAAASKAPHRVKLWHEHNGPLVGHALQVEDRDDGLWVNARFSNTLAGTEARELAADKSLDQVSITFRPQKQWMAVTRDAKGVHVRHSKAHLLGVALVAHGSYGADAYIASVRDADAETAERARELRKMQILAWNH